MKIANNGIWFIILGTKYYKGTKILVHFEGKLNEKI